MQKEIARIEYELTGSELIALLRESEQIKQQTPIYNRSLRRNTFPYGLYDYQDENGYIRLHVTRVSQMQAHPLASFSTKKEGTAFLERIIQEYHLCTKLCGLYKSNGSCFQYAIKNCSGACVQEESAAAYNRRCQLIIDELSLNGATFFIVDKGRHRSEKSLIYVKNGTISGIGYAPFHFRSSPIKTWEKHLDYIKEDRDAKSILKLFLRKNKSHEVVNIMDA
jgi:DNA polymerase-3 subunit epsilon